MASTTGYPRLAGNDADLASQIDSRGILARADRGKGLAGDFDFDMVVTVGGIVAVEYCC